MTDPTQILPLELLVEILEHASAPDLLRFKLVNRIFRNAIVASPLAQHKLDLFATGLQYNAGTGISLEDRREALLRYRANLDSLCPEEERILVQGSYGISRISPTTTGGVCAIAVDLSIQLCTMGSASRRIPHKEWKIPLPVPNVYSYCFYPGADVIAFASLGRQSTPDLQIRLRTMSDSGNHPAAQYSTIYFSPGSTRSFTIFSMSITSFSLVVVIHLGDKFHIVVWNWKSAVVLFELENDHYGYAEFLDDHRLLIGCLRPRADEDVNEQTYLALVDTGKRVGGTPIQTHFYLSPYFTYSRAQRLILERGAHKPPLAESLAPFRQDPSQRIIALYTKEFPYILVLRVGSMLELLKGSEGAEILWDQWKDFVVAPSLCSQGLSAPRGIKVSGCRLFYVYSTPPDPGFQMEVHDFSMQGRAKYLNEQTIEGLGALNHLSSTGVRATLEEFYDLQGCGGNIIFSHWVTGDNDSTGPSSLRIWTF